MKKMPILTLILFSISCSRLNDNVLVINPEEFSNSNITLSEIACDVEYLKLDNSFPIGISYQLRLTNDFIYYSIKDIGIVKFDWNGKPICKFGKKGRGPGEYTYGMQFAVGEDDGLVFVLDRGKVKVYSSEGLFIKDIDYTQYFGNILAGDIEYYHSLLFIPDYNFKGDARYNWVFLDTLGNLVKKEVNTIPEFTTNVPRQGNVYRFEDRLFYYNYFNDTIFSISPDLGCKSEYIFLKGEARWPTDHIEFKTEEQFLSKINNLFQPINMFETKQYIFLEYALKSRYAICLINKNTGKTYLQYKEIDNLDYFAQTIPFIMNDIDGGLPLSGGAKYYYIDGKEYIVSIIDPLDLKKHVSQREFTRIVPKYPEKKVDVEKLANSLSETDNPVLMMVRLKE